MRRSLPTRLVRTSGAGWLALCLGLASAAGPAADDATGPAAQQIVFTSMRTGVSQLFRIDADGSREMRLTDTQSSELHPRWSRQGRIAFVSYRSGNGDIYSMSADGRDVRRLTSGPGLEQSPAWSPDGTRLAYVGEREGRSELRVVNADGSGDMRVAADFSEVGAPVWSPDGGRIAFVATIAYKTRIVVADLSSGTAVAATDGKGGESGPIWSPDGQTLVYVQTGSRTEGVNIRMVRLGSQASVALTSGGYTYSQPSFSPDGTKILYLGNASTQGGPMNVHVMNADGTGKTNLTRWEHADLYATWSGDGSQVFFMSFRDWPGQIYRIGADGRDVRRLTRSQGQDGFPVAQWVGSSLRVGSQRIQ